MDDQMDGKGVRELQALAVEAAVQINAIERTVSEGLDLLKRMDVPGGGVAAMRGGEAAKALAVAHAALAEGAKALGLAIPQTRGGGDK